MAPSMSMLKLVLTKVGCESFLEEEMGKGRDGKINIFNETLPGKGFFSECMSNFRVGKMYKIIFLLKLLNSMI